MVEVRWSIWVWDGYSSLKNSFVVVRRRRESWGRDDSSRPWRRPLSLSGTRRPGCRPPTGHDRTTCGTTDPPGTGLSSSVPRLATPTPAPCRSPSTEAPGGPRPPYRGPPTLHNSPPRVSEATRARPATSRFCSFSVQPPPVTECWRLVWVVVVIVVVIIAIVGEPFPLFPTTKTFRLPVLPRDWASLRTG